MIAKTDKTNKTANTLLKAGWYANVSFGSDGLPILYVRVCSFEKLLLEAIDEGLHSLCGSSKQVIYSQLEMAFNIKRQDIPFRIEEFTDAIEKILGFGAKVLEVRIMERLNEKVGQVEYPKELGDLIFTEYVAAVRRSFLKKKNRFVRVHNIVK